jgi:hypothetical protein
MYRKLRDQRERQIRAARQRAHEAKIRAERAEVDRVAIAAAAAAAPTAAPEAAPPASPAATPTPAPQPAIAASSAPVMEPAAAAKLPEATPKPPEPAVVWDTPPAAEPAPPEPKKPAEETPAPPIVWEDRTPPKPAAAPSPPPAPEPEPVAAAPEPEPEPEPAPAASSEPSGGAGWEIVEPANPKVSAVAADRSRSEDGSPGRAAWELGTAEQEKADTKKKKGRWSRGEDASEGVSGESPLQVVMGYAGLVAALLLVLLGILFMIGAHAGG